MAISISFFVATLLCVITFATFRDYGVVWDEPVYFANGVKTWSWIIHPRLVNKDAFFAPVEGFDIHPPFRKLLSGMTHDVFTKYLGVTDMTTSYRLSSLFFIFPLMFVFAALAISWFGVGIGVLISVMFFFLPSIFFLAHVVTLDWAIMAFWFFAVMALAQSKKNNIWLWISAFSIAGSLLTKFHGVILYIPIMATWFSMYREQIMGRQTNKRQHAWKVFAILIAVPLVLYILFWPWLWTSPLSKFLQYLHMQFSHGNVPVYFLGKEYKDAPWYYAPFITLVTTPVFILFTAFVGAVVAIRSQLFRHRFILLNALFPLIFFSLPGVPRYDGVRLFISMYPFICLLSGFGIQKILSLVRKPFLYGSLFVVIWGLWIATFISSVGFTHPYESSYYNELIGGVDGANKKGMEVDYWGSAYLSVLPWMNGNKEHMQCVFPTTDPFYYYQAMGQIESGVVFNAGKGVCEYYVVLMRPGLFYRDPSLWKLTQTTRPEYSVLYSHTPIVNVYKIK